MFSRRFLRIKVIKALYAHYKSGSESMPASEKNLIASIDKAYDLYFQMLRLVADVKPMQTNVSNWVSKRNCLPILTCIPTVILSTMP